MICSENVVDVAFLIIQKLNLVYDEDNHFLQI